VVRIANSRNGEGFIAVSAEARKKFWLDRKRTAAISRHTNAFKINEDVVIPLPRMAEYTDGIERINIELSLRNKLKLCDALEAFFSGAICRWASRRRRRDPRAELLEDRVQQALALVRGARAVAGLAARRGHPVPAAAGPRLRASWKTQLKRRCADLRGAPSALLDEAAQIHQRVLKGRVGGAAHARRRRQCAHQHPGQLRRLRDAADRARGGGPHHGAGAQPGRRDLGRARHRHHQAGIPERRGAGAFADYKQRVDPKAASTRAS
jgi:FAD/FMN-containing dehydrogenase